MTGHAYNAALARRPLRAAIAAIALTAAFLSISPSAMAASDSNCVQPPREGQPAPPPSKWNKDCGTHNMLIVGEKTMFLSHLPMFDSEHRFQVILEARLKQSGRDVTQAYFEDRASHPQSRMYTLMPADLFVLSRVTAKDAAATRRKSFDASVFRGHLERDPHQVIKGLDNVEVEIQKVLYAAELPLGAATPGELKYILFGEDNEFYLAHMITQAPDFDQVIGVTVGQNAFKSEELARGITITIPSRANSPGTRLRANERVQAKAHVTGAHEFIPVQVTVAKEFYFEEGELKVVPVMSTSTKLEKEAGF